MSEESKPDLITIFKGSKEQQLYVYVPRESGEENIPDELRKRMGLLTEVMTLRIGPDKKLARANAINVLKAIKEVGYYVQLPPEISMQVLNDGD